MRPQIMEITCTQLAAWRNGGSNPAGSVWGKRTFVARNKGSEIRRCAKPIGHWLQCGESAVEN